MLKTIWGAAAHPGRVAILLAAIGLVASAACTATEVTEDLRTDYVPRHHVGDRRVALDVRVVDGGGAPLDGVHVRLRGVRHLGRFRDRPEAEFYLFGRSGDAGEPGLLRFTFPAPPESRALDLYLVTTDARGVRDSHYYPGAYWDLTWLHREPVVAGEHGAVQLVVEPAS